MKNNKMRKFGFLVILIAMGQIETAKSQSTCAIKLDSVAIYFNQNLDGFIVKLKTEKFKDYKNKKYIPNFIQAELDCVTGNFSMANPNEEYRCCCTSSSKLPIRKLLFLGVSENTIAMTYLTGGIGVSTHILLISYNGTTVTDVWNGNTFLELKSKKDILSFIIKKRSVKLLHINFEI